jgi:sugar lactone lactonase YvrE
VRFALRTVLLALAVANGGCDPAITTAPLPSPPTSAALWTISGSSAAIIRFDEAQLNGTDSLRPATMVTTSSARLFTLAGVAFDSSGTLWIASADDSMLLAFDQASLSRSGSSLATTVIESVAGSLSAPTGIAFDRAHRLWVANHENGTLVRFTVDQLSSGGPQQPAVVISGLGNPAAVAFDASGSLWVSDNVAHTISRFAAPQLESSGKHTPEIVLSALPGSILHPSGLAFDEAGTLWVANLGTQAVIAFGSDQLSRSGAPFPRRVLAPTADPLRLPVGLAFDATGNLWVVGGTGTLTRFDKASLDSTGPVEPRVRFSVTEHSLLWSAAFWPTPVGLPLN